jgi:O-antigen/teichoic acid export membrane protein
MAVELSGLGLNLPIIRAVAAHKEKAFDYLIMASLIGLVTSFLALVVMRILVFLLDYPIKIQAASNLLMWAVFPSVIIFFCEAIFLALNKAKYVAGISFAENFFKVMIGFVLLTMGKSVLSLFFVILCLRFLTCAGYLLLFWISTGGAVFRFDWTIMRELRQISPVFTANLLIGVLFGRIDIILLSKFGTMIQVGFYSAALRLIQIARIAPDNLLRGGLPAMSEAAQAGMDRLKELFLGTTRYMTLYGTSTALGVYLFAGSLIRVFFGDNLIGAVVPLKVLALVMIPVSLNPILASLLISVNRQFLDLVSNIARVIFLLTFCFLLVPHWGGQGAAIALVASETVLFFCLWAFVETRVFKSNILCGFKWPSLAAIVALASGIVIDIAFGKFRDPVVFVAYSAAIISFEPFVRRDILFYSEIVADKWRYVVSRKEASDKTHHKMK